MYIYDMYYSANSLPVGFPFYKKNTRRAHRRKNARRAWGGLGLGAWAGPDYSQLCGLYAGIMLYMIIVFLCVSNLISHLHSFAELGCFAMNLFRTWAHMNDIDLRLYIDHTLILGGLSPCLISLLWLGPHIISDLYLRIVTGPDQSHLSHATVYMRLKSVDAGWGYWGQDWPAAVWSGWYLLCLL